MPAPDDAPAAETPRCPRCGRRLVILAIGSDRRVCPNLCETPTRLTRRDTDPQEEPIHATG